MREREPGQKRDLAYSIMVPIYNEAQSIEELCDRVDPRVRVARRGREFEIIFVERRFDRRYARIPATHHRQATPRARRDAASQLRQIWR
jgi:hypothetical protein